MQIKSTFGNIEFVADITIPADKMELYASRHFLFHVANGAVEKEIVPKGGKRGDISYTPDIGAKLQAAYAKQGITLSGIQAYVPQTVEPKMAKARSTVAAMTALGLRAQLAEKCGLAADCSEDELVEAVHAL